MKLQPKLVTLGLIVASAATISCNDHKAAAAKPAVAAPKASAAAAPKATASAAKAAPKASAATAAPKASAGAATATAALPALPAGWEKYQAKDYGFSMFVPKGTKFTEKKFGGGWAGLVAKSGVATLVGVAEKGEKATPDDIEKFGVKYTKIPAKAWKQIGQGKDVGGWVWYKTVEAHVNGKVIIGDYGEGKTMSYMLLVVTTPSDWTKNQADYQTWYKSIQLS